MKLDIEKVYFPEIVIEPISLVNFNVFSSSIGPQIISKGPYHCGVFRTSPVYSTILKFDGELTSPRYSSFAYTIELN